MKKFVPKMASLKTENIVLSDFLNRKLAKSEKEFTETNHEMNYYQRNKKWNMNEKVLLL
jgi:hypothetical protein